MEEHLRKTSNNSYIFSLKIRLNNHIFIKTKEDSRKIK